MELIEVLRGARKLVEAGWTQGSSARDASGNPISSTDPYATCFCMLGAIARAYDDAGCEGDLYDAELAVRKILMFDKRWFFGISGFNDEPERTKDEVLEVFDLAIERTA